MLEKYKCTAVSHPLLQVIFHGLNVPSMWFSGSKVPQDSLSEMSNLAPHVQCSHKHCYVAHCGMPLSPPSSMQVSLLSSFCDNSHTLNFPLAGQTLLQDPKITQSKSKTCPYMPKNWNLKMSKADELNLQVRSLEPDSWLTHSKREQLHAPRWPLNYLF